MVASAWVAAQLVLLSCDHKISVSKRSARGRTNVHVRGSGCARGCQSRKIDAWDEFDDAGGFTIFLALEHQLRCVGGRATHGPCEGMRAGARQQITPNASEANHAGGRAGRRGRRTCCCLYRLGFRPAATACRRGKLSGGVQATGELKSGPNFALGFVLSCDATVVGFISHTTYMDAKMSTT